MKIKVYRAADAFLYLPTYVAEELDIFKTLLRNNGDVEIEFLSSGSDVQAIKEMAYSNEREENSLAIAIADPITILSNNFTLEETKKCQVIGAIIDKLPFWAVNHQDGEFDSIEEFSRNYDRVLHYDDNLITGFYLGKKVRQNPRITGESVAFGQEIKKLDSYNMTDHNTFAISADVISIVQGMQRKQNPIKINYRFSKEERHLTTGIITNKIVVSEQRDLLIKLIEGIQKSISIIYTSEKVARDICQKISRRRDIYPNSETPDLDQDQIIQIIELINKEKFYPAKLFIERTIWKKSAYALAKTEQWTDDFSRMRFLKSSFSNLVTNDLVKESGVSIARQFGIDFKSFGLNSFGFWIGRAISWLTNFSSKIPKYLIIGLLIVLGVGLLIYTLYGWYSTGETSWQEIFIGSLGLILGLLPLIQEFKTGFK